MRVIQMILKFQIKFFDRCIVLEFYKSLKNVDNHKTEIPDFVLHNSEQTYSLSQ